MTTNLDPKTISRLHYLLLRSLHAVTDDLREYYRLGYKASAEYAVEHIEQLHAGLRDTGFTLDLLDLMDEEARTAYGSVLANLDG